MNINILEDFGLTKNEIALFIVFVKKGILSPTQAAKETGLNRPYVYYALERLLEKGYLSAITENGKKKFKAISLDNLKNFEEHKLELLNKLFISLNELKKEEGDISVEVLKGRGVIKNIFKKILTEINSKEEVLSTGIDEEKMEELEPIYLRKILDYFKKKKITERIIIKKGKKTLEYAKTAHYRFIDPLIIGNTARIIYQDTVIDILYGFPVYAIIEKNQLLADTARKQFEVFWKLAKP